MPYNDQIPEDEYTLVGNQAPHETVITIPSRMLRGRVEARGMAVYDADADVWIPVAEFHNVDGKVPARMIRLPNGDINIELGAEGSPIRSSEDDIEPGDCLLDVMGRLSSALHSSDSGDDDSGNGGIPVEVRR